MSAAEKDAAVVQVVPLSKSIKAHNEELDQLELRKPTVEEIMDVGTPFLIIAGDDEQKIEVRNKVIGKYISLLAGIPISSVKQLEIPDFLQAQAKVLGFFGQDVSETA